MAETGKKVIITVLCVILMCGAVLAAVLYAEGYYDFTFIDRKQKTEETQRPSVQTTPAESTDTEPEFVFTDAETEAPPIEIPDAAEYFSNGYTVTGDVFSSGNDIIAKLPISLPDDYVYSTALKPSVTMKYAPEGIERIYEYSQKDSDFYSVELYMGYIIVSKDGVSTFYDSNGQRLVATESDILTEFIYQRDENGNPVFRVHGADYIISDGAFKISSSVDKGLYYSYPSSFGEKTTLYAEKRNGKWVYMTQDGELAFDPDCDMAYNFSEGYGLTLDDGKIYCCTEKGKETFNAFPVGQTDIYGTGSLYFDSGYVMVRKIVKKKGEVTEDYNALVNSRGVEFSLPAGTKLISYSNQRLLLEKDGKFGFYALKNDWTAEMKYTYATPFCEGLAVVGEQNGKKGVIDVNGNVVVPFEYDRITECCDGVFTAYSIENGWSVFAKLSK